MYYSRSALQTLHKVSGKAREQNYFLGGLSHDWVSYYEQRIESDRSCLNEWHAMDNLESKRPPSPDSVRTKWVRLFLSFWERRKEQRLKSRTGRGSDDRSSRRDWQWHCMRCIQKFNASRKRLSRWRFRFRGRSILIYVSPTCRDSWNSWPSQI